MNQYRDDFYVGKRFKYLGVTMLVVGFVDEELNIQYGSMITHYITAEGTLMKHIFSEYNHAAVVSELNHSGTY